ncbi:unnamed protein product [Ilex paraguariensis]|uniref:Uncharacterized protein n=1 Tax=Ilex paraguariensis TaxID=185542 RepID=A0ABC8RT89_9AQUA
MDDWDYSVGILGGGMSGGGVNDVEVGGAGTIDRRKQRAGEEDREMEREVDGEYLVGGSGGSHWWFIIGCFG